MLGPAAATGQQDVPDGGPSGTSRYDHADSVGVCPQEARCRDLQQCDDVLGDGGGVHPWPDLAVGTHAPDRGSPEGHPTPRATPSRATGGRPRLRAGVMVQEVVVGGARLLLGWDQTPPLPCRMVAHKTVLRYKRTVQ